MNWPCRLLLVACSCGITVAQEVPNINDAYAVDRATKLGPSTDPTDILERYADRMRGCNRLDYTVSVTYTLAPEGEIVEVQGAVAVGRGPGGRFDRFWFDATGTMPDVGEINVTIGSTGRGFYVINRLKRTVTEFEDRDDSIPFGSLARHVLVSDLAIDGAPVVESRHAADVVVHFVDEAFGEHVYSVFSEQDWLPRVIEWVGPGSRAPARGVRMRITNLRLDDADSGKLFDIAVPDDFRWLSGSKR